MKIDAFRCDICGKISEDPMPWKIDDSIGFHIKKASYTYSNDQLACSDTCAAKAAMTWMLAQNQDRTLGVLSVEKVSA